MGKRGKGVLLPGGKLGLKSGGKGALFDSADECNTCCPAPCECPEGLSTNYCISWTGGPGDCEGSVECSDFYSSPQTLTRFEDECLWSVSDGFDSINLILNTDDDPNCFWQVVFVCDAVGGQFADLGSGVKNTGNTPVGSYVWTDGCSGGGSTTIANVVITDGSCS